MGEIIPVEGLGNAEFLRAHAAPGRVGLVAGNTWADRLIARAERRLNADRAWGQWTHAFVFEGTRADGREWVVESDLEIHGKHVRLGVQENRVDKYHDDADYASLAVIDFGLTREQEAALVREALELVATRARYSIRELLGTAIGLRRPDERGAGNRMSREHSYFCSAFVRHVFHRSGVDLLPGIDVKHTTPEELSRSPLPFRMWVLRRGVPTPLLKTVAGRVRRRLAERRRGKDKDKAKG